MANALARLRLGGLTGDVGGRRCFSFNKTGHVIVVLRRGVERRCLSIVVISVPVAKNTEVHLYFDLFDHFMIVVMVVCVIVVMIALRILCVFSPRTRLDLLEPLLFSRQAYPVVERIVKASDVW